tara:strand:- start:8520 stop:9287 length:768 start_codon:yes stop_codon:yes gene_type:complete
MKILSIDVGIKNLAVCILSVINKEYTIEYWDVINLCGDNNSCYSCNSKTTFYNKNNLFFCKKCAKKNTTFIIKCEKLNKLSSLKKADFNIISEKYGIDFSDTNNLKDKLKICKKFVENNCFNVNKKSNANKFSLVDLGIAISKKLNNDVFLNVDKVLIENQIGPIANRMKSIQGMITQFFIMKNISNIEFLSSSNKLKEYYKEKCNYKKRKQLSIEITEKYIKLSKWESYFSTHKKKDDLADSYLQGLWYIKHAI